MDKSSLLNEIKDTLAGLLDYTKKLENKEHPVHQIDRDLLLEKTRKLYEKMMALENMPTEEQVSETEEKTTPAAVGFQKEEIPVVEENMENPEKTIDSEPVTATQEPSIDPESEKENTSESEKIHTATKPEKESPAPPGEPPLPRPEEAAKTPLDLFSTAPPETLGDTLKPSGKPALADSLQMNSVNDLREAIGINDKFLFINELFNGDLQRYNKVIDELNSFSGLLGAQTYLTELQVQYQWDENGTAYQKLNMVLERKFA